MADQKKRYMSKQEASKTVPVLKEFNALSRAFIKLLGQRVETKEKRVNKLSIMVTDMKIPQPNENSTIMVQTIDINDTRVKKKGSWGISKEKMNWEDDVKRRNRGIIL